MTDPGSPGSDETFEVSDAPESAASARRHEGTNVCRAAAIASRFGGTNLLEPVQGELQELGLRQPFLSLEAEWATPNFEELRLVSALLEPDTDRVRAWRSLNAEGRAQDAAEFLVAMLGSPLERESVAAAAALRPLLPPFDRLRDLRPFGPWSGDFDLPEAIWGRSRFRSAYPFSPGFDYEQADPDEDGLSGEWYGDVWRDTVEEFVRRYGGAIPQTQTIAMLAEFLLARALGSPDPVTRSMARAVRLGQMASLSNAEPPPDVRGTPPGALTVSTMIHGTWGWKGDWWRPAGGFHTYVLGTLRPNLYDRGARYSWSGAYSRSQRIQAAADLCDWRYEVAPNGLQTVFAHSYGAEVAARAITSRLPVRELVLLSAPVSDPVRDLTALHGLRVVDIRLRFDPVLGLARTAQRVAGLDPQNVVVLNQWRLDHSATHNADVWLREDIARRANL